MFERRNLLEPVQFRAQGTTLIAAGVAIRYHAISKDLGGWVERALPSCARKTIQEQDIVALRNHDPDALLGRLSAGTLRLHNSDTELAYEIVLPDTTVGRDTATLLERGDIVGSSFGFRNVRAPEWSKTEDGRALRSLTEISIRDLGPVTFPAYEATSAELALRSLSDQVGIDVPVLMDAAASGTLAEIISKPDAEGETHQVEPEVEGESESESEGDSRDLPTIDRPRIAWLYS